MLAYAFRPHALHDALFAGVELQVADEQKLTPTDCRRCEVAASTHNMLLMRDKVQLHLVNVAFGGHKWGIPGF